MTRMGKMEQLRIFDDKLSIGDLPRLVCEKIPIRKSVLVLVGEVFRHTLDKFGLKGLA